ncbi:MAG: Asp-tRNA(Asn)/Glu-tRNA(Gln) amidotransferase subunit GatB [Pirellulaceae bacterium]
MTDMPHIIIIGLEVHVQLQTQTKMFCRCSTRFGAAPNTQTCPVCIGMPGSLPVMNREAFQLALRTAVALHCAIPEFTKWDRKNYYYPDLPKGYQISQFDLPMSQNGYLEIRDPKREFASKRVRILRAHLEEDAGKSMHDEAAGKADSRIDLNRTGTPLLEIVTEPDIRSHREARAFLTELKLLLAYLGVSDCNMQEGSLRVDANINLHVATPAGDVATPIVEVKNMNSFRAVERALAFEAQRQLEVWKRTGRKMGDVPKQTRGWDESAQMTRGQRHKEESSDYRYFPDPDLVPVVVKADEVARVKTALGELPAALRARLETSYEIDAYDADVLVNQGAAMVEYFETVALGCRDGKRASNWVQQDVLRTLKEREIDMGQFPVKAESLATLIQSVQKGDLDNTRAKEVFREMITSGKPADQVMQALGIAKVDESELDRLCRSLLEANPKILADLRAGKQKAAGALIGQAKKQNPNVNPGQVREIVMRLAEEM